MRKLYWIAGIIGVLFVLAAAAASMNPGTKTEKQTQNLLEKDSGFTLDECNQLCDMAYDVEIQADACKTTCSVVGKEGTMMDRTANRIIEIYNSK